MMAMTTRHVGKGALLVAAVAALGAVVMLLWNAVVPAAFPDARAIGYPHALGLLVLCRILFGGFRGRGGPGRWRRWEAMSEEERAHFKRGMRRGCRPDAGDAAP